MRKWFLLFFTFVLNCYAQEFPVHLDEMLKKSQDYFEIYNNKSADEIDDDSYDESEYYLFAQVDQVTGLDIVFTKEEIKCFRFKLVVLISESFNVPQIEAIIAVAKSPEMSRRRAAKYFEVALEYKLQKISHANINSRLSDK